MLTKENANNSPGFLQVLMALKENIFNDLQVATVAIVTQIIEDADGNRTVLCRDFGDTISFQAYCLYNMDVLQGDVVVILYTDKDFRTNLKKLQSGDYEFTPNSEFETRHTKANGIAVGVLYRR